MATDVEVPSIDFSAFYYQQIFDALLEYKRQNVPEHTDESEYDEYMQFLRMNALVGHINNCLVDLVANESTLPTSKLVETVRNMMRLIDYELATAAPAQADVVFELSKVFAATAELIGEDAQVATERGAEGLPIIFEVPSVVSIVRTDQFGKVFGLEGSTYTDYTTKANSQATPADDWTPWTGAVAAKDVIYFGHADIMWDKLGLWFTTPMAGTKATGAIKFITKAALVDGETFTLHDGPNPGVTFHFNKSGTYTPPGGYDSTNIEVDISGDTTAAEVAITGKAAINGVTTGLLITGGAIVAAELALENDVAGTQGNKTIYETVTDPNFNVYSNMSGGTDGIIGVWEYYDGDFRKANPTEVQVDVPAAGKLLFDLTGYLGAADRTGTQIRVQLNETTAYADVESAFGIPAGSGWGANRNYVVVNSYLGQTVPSTTTTDYTVGSDWEEVSDLVDGSSMLSQNGDVEFTLPQALTENWIASAVNGTTALWLRYRVISVTGVVDLPTFQYGRIDQGGQYVLSSVTQGETVSEVIGSSDGTASQRFDTTNDYFISGTMTPSVDGEAWSVVENFLSSSPTDKHCTVEIGEDDRATVVFGDGVKGQVPSAGVDNVEAEYRHGAELDGNVGSSTLVVNKSGIAYINRLWNPRPAAGWSEAEGASEASLEQAKVAGPASLRTGRVALSPDDVETLTLAFTDETGARPFSRAKAIEEGFGVKTIELVVVAAGGAQASASQLAALNEYFNGDPYSTPPKEKHFVANQQVTAVNFTPKTIAVTATVYGDVTAAAIESRLAAVIQPEALKDDGVTFEWEFGADVPTSRVSHEIFESDEDTTKVTLAVPAADVPLSTRELPVLGAVTITLA